MAQQTLLGGQSTELANESKLVGCMVDWGMGKLCNIGHGKGFSLPCQALPDWAILKLLSTRAQLGCGKAGTVAKASRNDTVTLSKLLDHIISLHLGNINLSFTSLCRVKNIRFSMT